MSRQKYGGREKGTPNRLTAKEEPLHRFFKGVLMTLIVLYCLGEL